LLVVVWAYPRGSGLPEEGETALDVVAYGAHIAAQLGAHLIKVKVPSGHVELEAAKRVYDEYEIPCEAIADRVRHVVQSAFDGRRIVIFSGGAKEDDEEAVLDEIRQIRDGGGFGSIIGRNVFQRERRDALRMLDRIISIYRSDVK
jgi:class I fructose-bisphosphate aldolase